ncbi:uncharacterized protein J3R85_001906 [Psidium guajava]|nr:uncharacterized protein J3R85_001906 [Psidium guajava]
MIEDLNRVFKDGRPWFINGGFLSLRQRDSKFCPPKADMVVADWIQMLELGVQFTDMEKLKTREVWLDWF